MSETKKTKSQDIAGDIAALLRARNPLLWIITREEARVERYLIEAAAAASYVPRTWDVAQGIADMAGNIQRNMGSADPGETLAYIATQATAGQRTGAKKERGLWIMRDLPVWLDGMPGAAICRALRNLARMLPTTERETAQAIVILTPKSEIPAELQGHATVIDWPLPDRAEIAAILDGAIAGLPEDMRESAAPNGTREAAIDAAVGLAGEEASACYAKSIVQLRKIDPAAVAKEKKRVVAKAGGLEWYDPIPGGLDAVGGLDLLKAHLVSRRMAWTPEARAYGLPAPKGDLLVGVPGCGKSLSAKAIATAWECPLLRVDLGAVKSKFVGESEASLRRVFEIIAAIGRCVVWFDEIEKAMAGATDGAADGGVSKDALGAILTWMQERTGEAFVIATANDVSSLPPELIRRFDTTWFVDLPNEAERAQIIRAAMRAHGRSVEDAAVDVDPREIAEATPGFTGAEIAALVPDAMYRAFADDGREITTEDLLRAAKGRVPLSTTMAEKLENLRNWARTRARPATSSGERQERKSAEGRQLDI